MLIQALVIFFIMLLPMWFFFSLIKVIHYQSAISGATEPQERAGAIRYRNIALFSLLLAIGLILLIIYVFVQMASIQC